MSWTRPEIISALALAVSALSLVLSLILSWRAWRSGSVHVWVELKSLGANCWQASIKIQNPTRYSLKMNSLSVPVRRFPIDAKQSFMLGNYLSALAKYDNDLTRLISGARDEAIYLTMPIGENETLVGSEKTGTIEVLLVRGALSVASKPAFTLYYWSLEKTPRYKTRKFRGRIMTSSVTIGLAQV